jgi:type II secretory pathway pseudopilin PulG
METHIMLKFSRRMRTQRTRRAQGEQGSLIMDVLIGLALLALVFMFIVPRFFGWRDGTQNKGAQSQVRDALSTSDGVYTDYQNYGGTTSDTAGALTALTAATPELTFVNADVDPASPVTGTVYAKVTNTGQIVQFIDKSPSGKYYCTTGVSKTDATHLTQGTFYGSGASYAAAAAACTASKW